MTVSNSLIKTLKNCLLKISAVGLFFSSAPAFAVSDSLAKLDVSFTGLNAVHVYAYRADGNTGVVSGKRVARSTWKTNATVLQVPAELIDLKLQKGKSTFFIDNVDCRSGACKSGVTPALMTVESPGLRSIHTDVYVDDGTVGNDLSQRHTRLYWQNQRAELLVFPQTFDVRIRQRKYSRVIDSVDCSSGSCSVDASPNNLNVQFAGLSNVHTDVLLPDGKDGVASGSRIARSYWKSDQTNIPVQPGVFDLRIRKGKSELILDDVDCTSGDCVADIKPAKLAVLFDGLSSVHTDVMVSDGIDNSHSNMRFTHADWKKNSAEIIVFPQVFDLRVRHRSGTLILDNIDCRSGSCIADTKPATLKVNFAGLKGIHTKVLLADGINDSAEGGYFTRANWKNEFAEIKVFPLQYDLKIQQRAASLIVDDVDCRSGSCEVNDLVASLQVDFPGLYGVHTSVNLVDDIDQQVTGKRVTHANWRTNKTEVPVLRGVYDVLVSHAVKSVFDKVDCRHETCEVGITGNAQITLVDGTSNQGIAEAQLYAYEKLPDGKLHRKQKGRTNEVGKVHFTLEGLGEGRVYVLKAYSPYGNYKKFYSQILTRTGAHEFRITKDGEYPLDTTPPEINISSPSNDSTVSTNGFTVYGSASDNNAIDNVSLLISDPVNGQYQATISLNSDGSWKADIPASAISDNQVVSITAHASDRALNRAESTVSARVVNDQSGPVITIVSHQSNDIVAATGFLLSGVVIDETGVSELTVSLLDSQLGTTVQRQLELSASGAWTLAVGSNEIVDGSTLAISLTAADDQGNTSEANITLLVVANSPLEQHMINRITFGATPELLSEVSGLGAIPFLEQQLSPATIVDTEFDQLISGYSPSSTAELQQYALLHMIYSRKQLREVMTQFWDNHFNTDVGTKREDADGVEHTISSAYELQENELFRTHALGNFRDLLEVSAKSPSMLIYLDSISNVASDANENYARELMELHTLKVDGGYTSDDVSAAAELLTGWTVRNGSFFFDAARHNFDAQHVLGVDVASGGVEQGDQLLDILASHPSTARFICEKLIAVFVNDAPADDLVGRCAFNFIANLGEDDQIARVLRGILTSPEFGNEYRSKIKTPLEFVVGAVRILDTETDASDLAQPIRAMGMHLFENPVPTGFSEIGSDWVSANLLIERMKWINQLSRSSIGEGGSGVDPISFFVARGHETSEGIANYLFDIALKDDHSAFEVEQALQLLNTGTVFSIDAVDADDKLRALEGLVLSFPEYQFQ